MPEVSVAHETFFRLKSPELKDLVGEEKVFSEQTHHNSGQLENIFDWQFVHVKG